MAELRIAISQFPVSSDILRNEGYISRHIQKAAEGKADIILFPETALSGYLAEADTLDWPLLEESLERISSLAGEKDLNVALGCHEKQDKGKPLNSIFLISNSGEITGSYAKNHLFGREKERFSPKENSLVVEINGVKCGFLICYDSWFPGLFETYREKGVKVLFLSYLSAGGGQRNAPLEELTKAQIISRAADYGFYISGSNSSSRYSSIPSGVAGPDGKWTSLKRHQPGVLFYDYPDESLGWTFRTVT